MKLNFSYSDPPNVILSIYPNITYIISIIISSELPFLITTLQRKIAILWDIVFCLIIGSSILGTSTIDKLALVLWNMMLIFGTGGFGTLEPNEYHRFIKTGVRICSDACINVTKKFF